MILRRLWISLCLPSLFPFLVLFRLQFEQLLHDLLNFRTSLRFVGHGDFGQEDFLINFFFLFKYVCQLWIHVFFSYSFNYICFHVKSTCHSLYVCPKKEENVNRKLPSRNITIILCVSVFTMLITQDFSDFLSRFLPFEIHLLLLVLLVCRQRRCGAKPRQIAEIPRKHLRTTTRQ